jgi:hypothetical protein
VTLLVVVVSKFSEGAWIAVLVIPLFVLTFFPDQSPLRDGSGRGRGRPAPRFDCHRPAYRRRPNASLEQAEELVAGPARAAGRPSPRLVLRKSTYRQFFAPLIDYVQQLRDDHADRDIVVIVPELIVRHWYQTILHNNRGTVLRGLLRLRGGPRVVVVSVPFYVEGQAE